jgi:hypothetical protein
MQRLSRMMTVLLLLAIGAALPGVQAFALSTSHAGHNAGCHHPRPVTPSPEPPSYQCCVNGHHWAIPSSTISPRPLVAEGAGLEHGEDLSPPSFVRQVSSRSFVPEVSPPGVSPLRI